VGVCDNILISSTIGRNKHCVPREVIAALINGHETLLAELASLGVGIHSTGGETADLGDLIRTVVVDSTVTARVPRSTIIDNSRISAGDVIVGLASFGRATYEDAYNSGIGSNGLTSARHDVFHASCGQKYPESYDPSIASVLVYTGPYFLTQTVKIDGEDIPIGKLVLSPTRTYAPVMKKLFDTMRSDIHGMVHCSGGGQTKVLHFVHNLHVVKDNLFETPPVFQIIQEASQTEWVEMYRVFNMGHRMEVYVRPEHANAILSVSQEFNIDAKIIGRVEACSEGKKLTIKSPHGQFTYQ
jgi:phosphoribosylformylglycinamidine cyclo-ligase